MSAQLERARALLEVRRPREAALEATKHLAEEPDSADGHLVLALAQMGLGEHENATTNAERAVQLAPEHAATHYVLALVHAGAGRAADAKASTRRALALDPTHAGGEDLLALLLLDEGDREAARAAAERALALDSEETGHFATHARTLVAIGERDEAEQSITSGLAHDPVATELHAIRGELGLRRGDIDQAIESFLIVLRAAPGDAAAQRGLLEAIRAQNRFYRWFVLPLRQGLLAMVRYRRWTVLTAWIVLCAAMAVLMGGIEGPRILRATLIAVLLVPKEIGNLGLMFHPLGRHLLTTPERVVAIMVTGLLVSAAGLGVLAWSFDDAGYRDNAKGLGATVLVTAMVHFLSQRIALSRAAKIRITILAATAVALVLWVWLRRGRQ